MLGILLYILSENLSYINIFLYMTRFLGKSELFPIYGKITAIFGHF